MRDRFEMDKKWLDVSVVPAVQRKGSMTVGVSMDMGSTNYRSRLFSLTNPGEMQDNYEINSDIIRVTDISLIKSLGPELFHNLEFIITDMTDPGTKPNKMFTEEHFVKGSLLDNVVGTPIARPSKPSKTVLVPTYLNALVSIALQVLVDAENTGVPFNQSCIHTKLAVALPPADMSSAIVRQQFLSYLAGHYKVKMPRYNLEFNILINEDDIYFDSEPNAVLFSVCFKDEDNTEKTLVTIDVGGKTSDAGMMVEGIIKDKVAVTMNEAGHRLLLNVAESYVQRTGKSEPSLNNIVDALSNGQLVRGASTVDIYQDIVNAKVALAQKEVDLCLRMLDKADTSIEDVDLYILHGRSFLNTTSVSGDKCNLDDLIMNTLHVYSPDTEIPVLTLSDTDCITCGMVCSYWAAQ